VSNLSTTSGDIPGFVARSLIVGGGYKRFQLRRHCRCGRKFVRRSIPPPFPEPRVESGSNARCPLSERSRGGGSRNIRNTRCPIPLEQLRFYTGLLGSLHRGTASAPFLWSAHCWRSQTSCSARGSWLRGPGRISRFLVSVADNPFLGARARGMAQLQLMGHPLALRLKHSWQRFHGAMLSGGGPMGDPKIFWRRDRPQSWSELRSVTLIHRQKHVFGRGSFTLPTNR